LGVAEAGAHAFAEAVAVFGGHFFPFVVEAAAAAAAAEAVAAEENAGEDEQTEGLPEVDGVEAEEAGDQPVPETHNDFAAEERDQQQSENCERCENDFPSHSFSLKTFAKLGAAFVGPLAAKKFFSRFPSLLLPAHGFAKSS
jgi:hypothetical protein